MTRRHLWAIAMTGGGASRLSRPSAFGTEAGPEATLLNLLDAQAGDIQYFYASCLPGEAAAVDDAHLHPFEPRQLRVSLRLVLP